MSRRGSGHRTLCSTGMTNRQTATENGPSFSTALRAPASGCITCSRWITETSASRMYEGTRPNGRILPPRPQRRHGSGHTGRAFARSRESSSSIVRNPIGTVDRHRKRPERPTATLDLTFARRNSRWAAEASSLVRWSAIGSAEDSLRRLVPRPFSSKLTAAMTRTRMT